MELIGILEENLGRTAIINKLPMQPGDVVDVIGEYTEVSQDVSRVVATGVRE